MDYSTWLSSPPSLDLPNNANTLRLFDDAPVRDVKKVKLEATAPPTNSNQAAPTKLQRDGGLEEELNRVNAENKRLTEMLTVVCENYNDLKRQLVDYMSKASSNEANNNSNKKRKTMENNVHGNTQVQAIVARITGESSSSDEEDSYEKPKEETIKAKITRVALRTEASDSTLILKDGYQWRKYGQKVTRDNPCPRAYFKCSFAPTCPVKKKVQRSLEDQSLLVATYEGEHNHAPPTQQEGSGGSGSSSGAAPSSSTRSFSLASVPSNTASAPSVTLDLTKPNSNFTNTVNDSTTAITTTSTTTNNKILNNNSSSNPLIKISSPEFQKLLAEQMASSLTKDPNFTAALAAAITGRFALQSSSD